MTVQELMARLSAFDPQLPVVMPAEDGDDFCLVGQAYVDTVQFREGTVQLADERDDGWVQVVRLFGPDDTDAPPS